MNTMEIRELCIKNNWFTNGDNEQYETLFDRVSKGADIEEIATIIWICSSNVTKEEVKKQLMSNEFAYTGTNVTISGFTWDQNHSYRRYYSTGPIQSMDNLPDEKNYRFHLWAYGNGGQSGGMTYYKPTSDYKSTLGILTGGVGIDSYGMKLNTTLLRFYLQNTNL